MLAPGVELEAELPEFEVEPGPELLTLVVAVPRENGFSDPEPHPTIEAIGTAAAQILMKTLGENCTLNPRQPKHATD